MSRCLIGIPTLNGPHRLFRCLQAIVECGIPEEVSVLVADDGSVPETLEQNKEIVGKFGVEMLTTGGARLGVAATWNRLARHTTSSVLVFLNDDVEVVPDWLDVLLYSIRQNEHAGVVSLNCITGTTRATALPAVRSDYNEARLMNGGGSLVTAGGAAFGVRRDVYDRVGGFDERYFCFYEEVDFCVSVRKLGLHNFIASHPLVYHQVGATTGDRRNLDAGREMLTSRAKFVEKWGATPADLRREFMLLPPPGPVLEWHSQLKFLRD